MPRFSHKLRCSTFRPDVIIGSETTVKIPSFFSTLHITMSSAAKYRSSKPPTASNEPRSTHKKPPSVSRSFRETKVLRKAIARPRRAVSP